MEKRGHLESDIMYTKLKQGGMGMKKIEEEYEINRMRGLSQVLQTADRQKGREQKPWAQEMLMKELKEKEPLLKIIKEMKEVYYKNNMEIEETGDRYEPWKMQEGESEGVSIKEIPIKYEKENLCVAMSTREVDGEHEKIPVHLIGYFENKGLQL